MEYKNKNGKTYTNKSGRPMTKDEAMSDALRRQTEGMRNAANEKERMEIYREGVDERQHISKQYLDSLKRSSDKAPKTVSESASKIDVLAGTKNIFFTIYKLLIVFFSFFFKSLGKLLRLVLISLGKICSFIFTPSVLKVILIVLLCVALIFGLIWVCKNVLPSVFNGVGGFFASAWDGICNFFSSIGGGIGNFFASAWGGICDFFASAWEFISGIPAGIWNWITSGFTSWMESDPIKPDSFYEGYFYGVSEDGSEYYRFYVYRDTFIWDAVLYGRHSNGGGWVRSFNHWEIKHNKDYMKFEMFNSIKELEYVFEAHEDSNGECYYIMTHSSHSEDKTSVYLYKYSNIQPWDYEDDFQEIKDMIKPGLRDSID